MTNLQSYFIYFIIYGYIFLLFLKGFYPANETGILFIGFLIFMTLAYKFAGSLINDELEARRLEVYRKYEDLLGENIDALSYLKSINLKISSLKDTLYQGVSVFLNQLEAEAQVNFEDRALYNLNYIYTSQLNLTSKLYFSLLNSNMDVASSLAIKQFLENKKDSEDNN